MNLDPVLLSRIQFAMTVGFHFIFPSITIGLVWLVAFLEWRGWRTGDPDYARMGAFFGKLLAITFAVGVATGITMEFQFGMNWSEYSRFVGDIFGAPLAAEAVLSFFLESTFLGLYLFGRNRVSKGTHFAAILLTALGATLSAFWIIVANSWQQTPAGFVMNSVTGRAELESFWAAVFNPSTIVRFLHVFVAGLITGGFLMAGVAAYLLLRDKAHAGARKALRVAVIVAFAGSVLELMPLGHHHAMQVGKRQPEKLATFEGLYETQTHAPFTLFGIPTENGLKYAIRVPGVLSLLVGMNLDTEVKGRDAFKPEDLPPAVLPFLTFHMMVGLGMLFIAAGAWGVFQLWRGRLYEDKWFLLALIPMIPLPVIACQVGWAAAEVGRQPWAVYHVLRTSDAVSPILNSGHILFSIVTFGLIYALLGVLYLYLMVSAVRKGPEPAPETAGV